MTSKEKMLQVLKNKSKDIKPVTPHWWGLYKFAHDGLISGYEGEALAWQQDAQSLFEIDQKFYENFKPDMFHLTTAPDIQPMDVKKNVYINDFRNRDDILESKSTIDEYLALLTKTEQEVLDSGVFDHVKLCSQKYGDDVFIALNEGSDVACLFDSHIGFENGLIGVLENPENFQYFLSGLYERTFERMKALKQCGAHGFINSETYCSADIISPTLYREIILPIQKRFYTQMNEIDLLPIAYFTGDIRKNMDDIKTLPLAGMMIESSKKGFISDVGEFAERIEGAFALFGNLDSHSILQLGTVDDVVKETKSQMTKGKTYPFIMSNDCPISFSTPIENIRAMIETARAFAE